MLLINLEEAIEGVGVLCLCMVADAGKARGGRGITAGGETVGMLDDGAVQEAGCEVAPEVLISWRTSENNAPGVSQAAVRLEGVIGGGVAVVQTAGRIMKIWRILYNSCQAISAT
jgi:hypothetical protein